jgi:hypothetical protein
MKETRNKGNAVIWVILVLIVLGLIGYYVSRPKTPITANQNATSSVQTNTQGYGKDELALRQNMRKLWSDHVFWTRTYIASAISGNPDASSTADRLLKNQEHIGSAIATYYGKEAGDKLTSLLKDHIMIAVDLVKAAKAGDNAKKKDADDRWHKNADEIATFLSAANPNWSKSEMLSMLNEHLSLTTQEAVYRLEKKWPEDITNFDKIFDQGLRMADALSEGIIKQFPQKFQ